MIELREKIIDLFKDSLDIVVYADTNPSSLLIRIFDSFLRDLSLNLGSKFKNKGQTKSEALTSDHTIELNNLAINFNESRKFHFYDQSF
ncbi:hypothetical protein MHLP_02255 [Candidatus Mycoplasma haematolamae str. Purdue]|uniref:Uncharacterized protein n=1 Tax=Mycoplasma haematolamae (strain Purdue) TaxID=1212765 RepID=I7CFP2_MYCHA|nr:hypothetical protein MHLP_02255 [Candidatus Mycoplasma haematolamae str. Purdue]